MFPPIISTSCLLIARPRPEPPCLRVVDPSAWANSSKMWDCAAALMPAPVSLTSKRSVTFCAVSSRPATRITTEPCSVNLIALPTRLVSTWPRRRGSPLTWVARFAGMLQASSSPLAWARSARRSTTSSSVRRRSMSTFSSSSFPASILEKSRRSLMMPSRFWPERCTVSAYLRCALVSPVSSNSSVIPRTPFIGVRISWLILARNELFAWFADSAASRAPHSVGRGITEHGGGPGIPAGDDAGQILGPDRFAGLLDDGRQELVFRFAFPKRGDQAFDVVRHVVERFGGKAHFRRTFGLDAHRVVALTETVRAFGKHAQRS